MPQRQLAKLSFLSINPQAIGGLPFPPLHPCHGYFSVIPLLFFPLILLSVFSLFHTRLMGEYTDYVKNMKEACAFASISVVPLLVDADAARRSTTGILEPEFDSFEAILGK